MLVINHKYIVYYQIILLFFLKKWKGEIVTASVTAI